MSDVAHVDILIVHGMGSPPEGYSDALTRQVAAALDLKQDGAVKRIVAENGTPNAAGVIRESRFKSGIGRTMAVHEVTWAPVINKFKTDMLAYDAGSTSSDLRSVVNKALKRDLINARLADPVLYLGVQKDRIQYPVKFAICRMLGAEMVSGRCEGASDESQWPRRIIMITYSLGSRITFDSVMALRSEFAIDARQPLDAFAKRTTAIFMLANQLPLLELADVRPATSGGEESGIAISGLGGFLRVRRSGAESGSRLSIAALSDPNDLLSYTMSEAFKQRFPEVNFMNVDIGVSGPGLFRLAANPLRAHIGHERDERVVRAIVEGLAAP